MPALRSRGSDLQLLAEHFAMKFAAESGWNHFPGFTTEALQHLFEHAWPGNVRELKNAIERSLHRQGDDSEPLASLIIDPFNDHAHSSVLPGAASEPETARASSDVSIPNDLRAALDLQERQWLRLALELTGHRQKQAAERLGLSYDQIRGLMKKHGLRTRGTRD
jgi:psp operon transcriptional activator